MYAGIIICQYYYICAGILDAGLYSLLSMHVAIARADHEVAKLAIATQNSFVLLCMLFSCRASFKSVCILKFII